MNQIKGQALSLVVSVVALSLTSSSFAAVTTFTFRDGVDPDGGGAVYAGAYSGTADNRLVSATEANKNYGGVNFMIAGRVIIGPNDYFDRGILRFDLSGLGNNAVTSPGTLTLRVSGVSATTGSGTLQAYVVNGTESWVEGTGDGNQASSLGWSTWNSRPDPAPAWTGGAGLGSPGGGSYGASVLDTFAWTSSSSGSFSLTIPQSVIQSWVNNPSGNNGLLLRAASEDDGSRLFLSTSDDATVSNRPQLVFDVDIPEPTGIALLAVGAAMLLRARRKA